MTTRITFFVDQDGELNLWMNPEGKDKLVSLLNSLSPENDHFHVMDQDAEDVGLTVSTIAYRPGDNVLDSVKFALRLDSWDDKYFPHVMPQTRA